MVPGGGTFDEEFGDFANIDIDKLLTSADSQIERMGRLQGSMAGLVGRAQDEDELVTVEYAAEGCARSTSIPRR